MKINLEKHHLESALKMKAGHTLGVVDTLLIHSMATSLQEGYDKPVFAWYAVDIRTGDPHLFTDLDGVNQALASNAYLEVTNLFTERHSAPVITDIARMITDNDKLMADNARKRAVERETNSFVIPEGYKLVPIEPTDEMIEAFYKMDFRNADTAYKAMIAAAPYVPVMESTSCQE